MNFNKEFWEKFIDEHGPEFNSQDEVENYLYFYSEVIDLEEEQMYIEIFTEKVLKVRHWDYDHETKKLVSIDWYYIPMDQIKEVRYIEIMEAEEEEEEDPLKPLKEALS